MKLAFGSARSAIVAGTLVLSLAGCGGGGGSSPTTPGTQPTAQQVRTPLVTGATFNVRANSQIYTNIDFPPAGKIDVTANWGGATNIEMYVTESSCPGFPELSAGRCTVLARAEGVTRPKSVTFDSQTGRIYSVWMANRGATNEVVGLEAGVTTIGAPPPPAQPTPTPSAGVDPRAGWAEGPVTQVKAYLKTIESSKGSRDYRPALQDEDGNWIVYVGEFVVVDSTQRNGAGLICKWIKDPVYSWDNEEGMMDIKGSSEPFFFKFEVAKKGYAEVSSVIDEIESNPVKIRALGHP
jgi:hypothetical protein